MLILQDIVLNGMTEMRLCQEKKAGLMARLVVAIRMDPFHRVCSILRNDSIPLPEYGHRASSVASTR